MAKRHIETAKLGSRTWTFEEVLHRLDQLFDEAATNGPQRIKALDREFSLSLVKDSSSPKGKGILGRGGPLEHTDFGDD